MLTVVFFITLILISISIYSYKFLANPFVLEVHYTLLFLVVPQMIMISMGLGESYWLSNWVILTYIVSLFLGTLVNIKAIKVSEIKRKKNTAIVSLLIAALLISPTLFILFDCGLSLGGIRCYYETVVFSKFAGFYELGKTFLFFSVLLFLLEYKQFKWWLVILILFVVFSGSKFAIFNLLIFFCIYLEIYKKIKVRSILLSCIPVALLLIIYHFIQTKDAENPFLAAISYFDIYEKQSFLLEKFETGKHSLYYGEINYSSYYKFIPRIFWEGKPYNYGFAILNYDFLPEFAAANYMPSFGLGSLYADFGIYSVVFGGFTAGFLRRYCYNIFKESGYNNTSLILYYFSFSILTFQYMIILVLVSFFLKKDE
ncbi:hypothetical protein [Flavobacterium sp.]|uniref:hypothetical protein n=1 Tax=Flavobacterium sp. TaxID=239 RepID=UPI0025BF3C49|nr:hypothetical protein [Flavobacterium sp.]